MNTKNAPWGTTHKRKLPQHAMCSTGQRVLCALGHIKASPPEPRRLPLSNAFLGHHHHRMKTMNADESSPSQRLRKSALRRMSTPSADPCAAADDLQRADALAELEARARQGDAAAVAELDALADCEGFLPPEELQAGAPRRNGCVVFPPDVSYIQG